ncbi:MAG TPA: glutathione binding-like protein, partial [Solirubrobacterales bacterium]|nr:glutathione binding-like protein [Solirubrobacterales bacterium]
VPRFWVAMAPDPPPEEEIEARRREGRVALKIMERHLREREYFVGERFSIADIALYAYTHVADEAGFDLESLPAVRAWIERVAAQPGTISIDD